MIQNWEAVKENIGDFNYIIKHLQLRKALTKYPKIKILGKSIQDSITETKGWKSLTYKEFLKLKKKKTKRKLDNTYE